MKRLIKKFSRDFLRKSGRELTFYPQHRYLKDFNIDCVLDVGANVGQFATEIRQYGYEGLIHSFEPLSSAITVLQEEASHDPLWSIHGFGIGDVEGELPINVSDASSTSSILQIDKSNSGIHENLKYIDTEQVLIKRLDSVYEECTANSDNVFLKIDTQGFEKNVLTGADKALDEVTGVQVEVSLTRVYEGEAYIETIISHLREKGLTPYWIQQGFRDNNSMQLLQADVFFFRK